MLAGLLGWRAVPHAVLRQPLSSATAAALNGQVPAELAGAVLDLQRAPPQLEVNLIRHLQMHGLFPPTQRMAPFITFWLAI